MRYWYKLYQTISNVHHVFDRWVCFRAWNLWEVCPGWFTHFLIHSARQGLSVSPPLTQASPIYSVHYFSNFKYLHLCMLLFGDRSRGHPYQRVDIQKFVKNWSFQYTCLAFVIISYFWYCSWHSYSHFCRANCMLFCGLRSFLSAWCYI